MFGGFNREVRNSLRMAGVRLRYAVAVCEIVAEQYGAALAANIALRLSSRGTGNIDLAPGGVSRVVIDSNGYIRVGQGGLTARGIVNDGLSGLLLSGTGSTTAGFFVEGNTLRLAQVGADMTIANAGNTGNNAPGRALFLGGGAAWNLATNQAGGQAYLYGGAGSGTGAAGAVELGWSGSYVCRVRVRNTILGLNGYTSSTAAATTTELPTSGDLGIHKNTTSGAVHLCFNDAGVIRSVQLT